MDLPNGLRSYGGFQLRESGLSPKYSAHPSGRNIHRTPECFRDARTETLDVEAIKPDFSFLCLFCVIFVFLVFCVSWYFWAIVFSCCQYQCSWPFSSLAWKDRPRNDLWCVERDVKHLLTYSLIAGLMDVVLTHILLRKLWMNFFENLGSAS